MFRFVYGVVFALFALGGAAVAGIMTGALPAGADNPALPGEKWAARESLRVTIARETKDLNSPLQPSDADLQAGLKAYAANCAVCHGASDGKPSNAAQGFYVKAPQLATDGVEDDPESETYWKLDHGVRFTAMPAFHKTLDETTLWQIAAFLKRMDKLPPAVDAQWKRVPSVAPAGSP